MSALHGVHLDLNSTHSIFPKNAAFGGTRAFIPATLTSDMSCADCDLHKIGGSASRQIDAGSATTDVTCASCTKGRFAVDDASSYSMWYSSQRSHSSN